ncbi:tetratricopeptide repeat protein [Altererythrobacter aurantiacus]|uniref:Tetratricopeptide repeat protein n=1 Tax=Parapontixanthobacter aurantiacus TaxID=1463599 RepID=A0A844ZC92_9SPHN|nr:tetratricopeptide repeat protein [Parapontixanthobacter aurantiacus]MXO84892.1 tetratricopeptide repeat protein [Parapontixanthobacter aurantiacus]
MALTPTNPKANDKKARREAAEGDVLMREVDEAVRQDDMAAFGKRYGAPLLAVVGVALLAFGGYLYWNNAQEGARERDSETLVTAFDQQEAGNLSAATQALEPLATGEREGARAIALMGQASIALQDGKTQAAAQMFEAIADDASVPDEIRELARVRQVSTMYDRLEPAETIRLLDAAAQPGRPFFASAAEMKAMALVAQGKRQEAGALFAQIAQDDETPPTLQSRARQMAGLMGVDSIDDPANVISGTATTTPEAGEATASDS